MPLLFCFCFFPPPVKFFTSFDLTFFSLTNRFLLALLVFVSLSMLSSPIFISSTLLAPKTYTIHQSKQVNWKNGQLCKVNHRKRKKDIQCFIPLSLALKILYFFFSFYFSSIVPSLQAFSVSGFSAL